MDEEKKEFKEYIVFFLSSLILKGRRVGSSWYGLKENFK